MKQAIKNTVRDAVVIVLAAVVLAAAYLFFTGAIKVHAMEVTETAATLAWTGGGECHAYNTSTGVIQPVYDYCHIAKGNGIAKDDSKNAPQARTETNTPIVAVTVDTPATPETPVIVIDDNGVTVDQPTVEETPVPDDQPETPATGGNPGNLKDVGHAGENPNGKDTMPLDSGSVTGNGRHGNQGQGLNQSSAIALFVTVLIAGKKRISFDGIRSVNSYGKKVTLFTYDEDHTIYVINNAKVERTFISEPPFVIDEEMKKYRM